MDATARAMSSTLRIGGKLVRNLVPKTSSKNPSLQHFKQYTVFATQTGRHLNSWHGINKQELITKLPALWNTSRSLSSSAVNITPKDDDECITIQWPDGNTIDYSYLWLRDSCLCPKCHEPSAKSRLLRMKDMPVDCKPKDVKVDGSIITVTWSDGHVSPFPSDWLRERGYSPENIDERKKVWPIAAELWGSELLENVPKDSFQNLMNNDRALYDWISDMEKYGFFLITDTPCEIGSVEEFSKRIAFLRLTNYG